MKSITENIVIATTLLFGVTSGSDLPAQTPNEMTVRVRQLAVPIKVTGAMIREVPSGFMHKLAKEEAGQSIKVLDLSVEAASGALKAFSPSLQPILYIGGKAYPVQRVEYSNWDARNEKPINKEAPIGETQIIHFFIENWQDLEEGQPMVLSILTPQEMKQMTKGDYTANEFNRIMPELKQQIPSFFPQEFLNLGR